MTEQPCPGPSESGTLSMNGSDFHPFGTSSVSCLMPRTEVLPLRNFATIKNGLPAVITAPSTGPLEDVANSSAMGRPSGVPGPALSSRPSARLVACSNCSCLLRSSTSTSALFIALSCEASTFAISWRVKVSPRKRGTAAACGDLSAAVVASSMVRWIQSRSTRNHAALSRSAPSRNHSEGSDVSIPSKKSFSFLLLTGTSGSTESISL